MEQEIQFCRAPDGVTIAYATAGAGAPIVKAANWLNHLDFDWRSPVWRHWFTELSRHHLLVRYDERGNGLSDWDIADFSFEAMVQDLECVVDAVGIERFTLLGISQGCAVSIAYAVRHPERVANLVMFGGYARGFAKRDDPIQAKSRDAMIQLAATGWGQDNPASRQLWTSLFIPDGTPEQMGWFNELQRVCTSSENAVRILELFGDIDVRDLLPKVRAPTLVLHSRGDAVVPFEEGRRLAAGIAGARLVALDSRNHVLLEHEPAWPRFLREVREFLGAPSADGRSAAPTGAAPSAPRLSPGDRLQQYRVESHLGSGGMGAVYRARDLDLDREVAVKVLPEAVVESPGAVERFRREARALARLSHPNVPVVYGFGEERGQHFLALELLPGETLADRLQRGALDIDEARSIGRQVASALMATHAADIVHRDLKPANVALLPDGSAKVLDFGIARLLPDPTARDPTSGATLQEPLTASGALVGTAPYMSPEQVRGRPVDRRADVWGFGCLMFEMLTGVSPFARETVADTLVAILEADPDWSRLPDQTPQPLRDLLRRCLAKDTAARPDSLEPAIEVLDS